MHNVNVEALTETIERARREPDAVVQQTSFGGAWNTGSGPQFRASIPIPNGDPVTFEADFPPPMGGTGSAPNPLAYCFWGGLACYAMTYAQEAARLGVELRAVRATAEAEVDQSRALGVSDNPPVDHIDWRLEVDADADADQLQEIKRFADDHCPGVYCVSNPIDLRTELTISGADS
jgi:uncharacterized OsmC-like protein